MGPWPPALVAHYFKNALALPNATLHNVIEKSVSAKERGWWSHVKQNTWWNVKYKMNLMQSKKRRAEIFKCLDFDVFGISPQFCVFSHCWSWREFFCCFWTERNTLWPRPSSIEFFLCLGFMIIYHQIQVSHHEIAHESNLHLHHPFNFHVLLDFVVTKTSSPIVASFVHSVVPLSSLYTAYITHLGSSFYNHDTCHDHDHLICCHLIH